MPAPHHALSWTATGGSCASSAAVSRSESWAVLRACAYLCAVRASRDPARSTLANSGRAVIARALCAVACKYLRACHKLRLRRELRTDAVRDSDRDADLRESTAALC